MIDDMPVLAQHVAVQLESLGVVGVGRVSMYLTAYDAKGRPLEIVSDGSVSDDLTLSVSDLMRPAVQSSRITARPAAERGAPSPRRAGHRRYTKRSS